MSFSKIKLYKYVWGNPKSHPRYKSKKSLEEMIRILALDIEINF